MNKITYILLSIIIALLFFLSKGIFVIILCGIIVGYIICKKAATDDEKIFLKRIYFFALILGITISSANFYFAAILKNGDDLIGDASAYSSHGAYIAEVLTNNRIKVENNYIDMLELYETRSKYDRKLPVYEDYRIGFFAYLYGYIYALFGYFPLIIKFLNLILGIIGCFLIYFWVHDVFGERQAKIALLLVLFLPSRFIWSTSGLKDTLVFFAFSLALFVFSILQKKRELFWACAILFASFLEYNFIRLMFLMFITLIFLKRKEMVSLLSSFIFFKMAYILIYGIRFHFVQPFMVALIISLVTFLTVRKLIILAICLITLSPLLIFKIDMDKLKERYRFETVGMIDIQRAQALAGEYAISKYKIYPDKFHDRSVPLDKMPVISLKEMVISYLIGMSYHFLSPFPWHLKSRSMMFGYIQSILIYLLLPFIAIGIIIGFRYHWREILPYLLLILVIASINSLFIGNMGTLFRHRDMVMPFFIAFGAIGLTHIFKMPRIVYER